MFDSSSSGYMGEGGGGVGGGDRLPTFDRAQP